MKQESLLKYMKEKCVFFMSSTNLKHIFISFGDSFQSSIDLVAWEVVTRGLMTVWIKLGFDKMRAIRMIFFAYSLINTWVKHYQELLTLVNLISVCLPFPHSSFLLLSFRSSFPPLFLSTFFLSLPPLLSSFIFFLSFLPYFLFIYFDFEVVSKILQREVEGTFRHGDRTVSNFHRDSRKKKQYEASATTVTMGNLLFSLSYIYNVLFMCYWKERKFCSSLYCHFVKDDWEKLFGGRWSLRC